MLCALPEGDGLSVCVRKQCHEQGILLAPVNLSGHSFSAGQGGRHPGTVLVSIRMSGPFDRNEWNKEDPWPQLHPESQKSVGTDLGIEPSP